MRAKRDWIRIGFSIAAAAVFSSAGAQVATTSTAVPNQYPPALPQRKGPPPPRLAIELVREIPVPERLQDGDLRVTPGGIEVPVPDGVVVTSISGDAAPVAVKRPGTAPEAEGEAWTLHPDGRLRYRALPGGYLLAERFHRCAPKGWRKTWRLRTPAEVLAPPVILGRRLFFTSLDDQAYCVRADNGHRLWAVDLGERVSRAMAVWSGDLTVESADAEAPRRARLEVLLVVPDSGASVIALDPYNGQRLATFTPPAGWFVSAPIVLPDARIAVARKGYAVEDAALAFLQIRAPAPAKAPAQDPVLYNPSPPVPDPTQRR